MVYLLFTKIAKAAFFTLTLVGGRQAAALPAACRLPLFTPSVFAAVYGLSHNHYLLYRMRKNQNALQNHAHTGV